MMKKVILCAVLGLCLFGWLPGAVQAEDRALLIGVGRYRLPEANLPGIDLDVAAMKQVCELLGFKSHQIKLVQDEAATLTGIKAALTDWLIAGTTPNDRAFFYFSGHGSQVRDVNGDEPDQRDEVLVTHDAALRGGQLSGTFLDDDFGPLLSQIKAKQVLVFLDACHSGTATRSFSMRSLTAPQETVVFINKFFYYQGMPLGPAKGTFAPRNLGGGPGNFVSLSAAQDDEYALATSQGSLFTRALSAAVRESVSAGRAVTMKELQVQTARYIDSTVADKRKVHHPNLFGNMQMADMNLNPAVSGPPAATTVTTGPGPTVTPPGPAAPAADPWAQLESLVGRAKYEIEVRANKSRFNLGDTLQITCRLPGAGYVNVLNVSPGQAEATVLFPNKYHQDNHVSGPVTLSIPASGDNFLLRAQPPAGKNLLVVIHTKNRVNAFSDGYGQVTALFKTLSAKSLRGFEVEEAQSGGDFGAGKVIAFIE
ncbi:MAG: caspase family protein [Pseudomonadota bacterium]